MKPKRPSLLASHVIFVPNFRDLCYRMRKKTRSFFSPLKGIPQDTTVTLTGDIRIEIWVTPRGSAAPAPKIVGKVGVRWGKNLKGADWISATLFQRNAELIPESLTPPLSLRIAKTLKDLQRASYRTTRRPR